MPEQTKNAYPGRAASLTSRRVRTISSRKPTRSRTLAMSDFVKLTPPVIIPVKHAAVSETGQLCCKAVVSLRAVLDIVFGDVRVGQRAMQSKSAIVAEPKTRAIQHSQRISLNRR